MTPNRYSREHIIHWVETKLFTNGERFSDPNAQAIGFYDSSHNLHAAVVYHNYCKAAGTIEMSCYSASRHWATKHIINLMFNYPFEQVGCRLVVARHSENHNRARRIWKALGAHEYVIPELRAEGEAEVIAVLPRTVWNDSKFKRS